MITVYHAETIIDAQLVKDRLEAEDIPAFIAGQYLVGGIGQLPARGLVSVGVPDSCEDRARPLVDEFVAMLAEGARERAQADDDADLDADNPGLVPGPA